MESPQSAEDLAAAGGSVADALKIVADGMKKQEKNGSKLSSDV